MALAARNGHDAVVQRLLATSQVDVDLKDRYGQTSLSYTARNGHDAMVSQPQARLQEQAASAEGYTEVVKLLLNEGADINAQGGGYGSALEVASSEGHEEIVKLLLDKGADINAQGRDYSQDKNGFTSHLLAVQNGHETTRDWIRSRRKSKRSDTSTDRTGEPRDGCGTAAREACY